MLWFLFDFRLPSFAISFPFAQMLIEPFVFEIRFVKCWLIFQRIFPTTILTLVNTFLRLAFQLNRHHHCLQLRVACLSAAAVAGILSFCFPSSSFSPFEDNDVAKVSGRMNSTFVRD